MSQEAPNALVDVQHIQFKKQRELHVFNVPHELLRSYVDLLAVSSTRGLIFVASPTEPELKVFAHSNLVGVDEDPSETPLVRTLLLPAVANVISCSADGAFLAVHFCQNNSAFLFIYSVQSFLTPNMTCVYKFRLSAEENVMAMQILWNPVITNMLAVILSNCSVGVYTLKEGGSVETHSLNKSHEAKCGCWSPKGKQIVLGFPNGKLQQFKPDLTPAKTIPCPPNVHPGPFDTIALHWLSTYQFAAVFVQCGKEQQPCIYIISALKGVPPNYVNYNDICYSNLDSDRDHKFTFTHIPQWNLLLVMSANGVEVGLLGTKESGDAPHWVQYMLLDEARFEMPLTESADDTYPLGYVIDTATSHQLQIADKELPPMPMVHVLTTYGQLVSFDFLNDTPGIPSICSPPPPLGQALKYFLPLEEIKSDDDENELNTTLIITNDVAASTPETTTNVKEEKQPIMFSGTNSNNNNNANNENTPSTLNFGAQSGANIFAQAAATKPAPATSVGFGAGNASTAGATTALRGFANNAAAAGPGGGGTIFAKAAETQEPSKQNAPMQVKQQQQQQQRKDPLYVAQPTFASKPLPVSADSQKSAAPSEDDDNFEEFSQAALRTVLEKMYEYDCEVKEALSRSISLTQELGSMDEVKSYSRRLHVLKDIILQAKDNEFELDMIKLRESINACYQNYREFRARVDQHQNPSLPRTIGKIPHPITTRRVGKLHKMLDTVRGHLIMFQTALDKKWSHHQDKVHQLTSTDDGDESKIKDVQDIYQRLIKMKNILARQRLRVDHIKTKLRECGLLFKTKLPEVPMRKSQTSLQLMRKSQTSLLSKSSLVSEFKDAELSGKISEMSLDSDPVVIRPKNSRMKIKNIRNHLKMQKEVILHEPKRPVGIINETDFVLEVKARMMKNKREGASTNVAKMQKEKLQQQQLQQQKKKIGNIFNNSSTIDQIVTMTPLAKPTATKPSSGQQLHFGPSVVPTQMSGAPTPPTSNVSNISFGKTSPFVKSGIKVFNVQGGQMTPGAMATVQSTTQPQATVIIKIPPSTRNTNQAPTAFAGFAQLPKTGTQQQQQQTQLQLESVKQETQQPQQPHQLQQQQQPQQPISFAAKVIGGGDAIKLPNSTTVTCVGSSAPPGTVAAAPAGNNENVFATLSTKGNNNRSNNITFETVAGVKQSTPFTFGQASATPSTGSGMLVFGDAATGAGGDGAFGGVGKKVGSDTTTATQVRTTTEASASATSSTSSDSIFTAGEKTALDLSTHGSTTSTAATITTTSGITNLFGGGLVISSVTGGGAAALTTTTATTYSTTAVTTTTPTAAPTGIDKTELLLGNLSACEPTTKQVVGRSIKKREYKTEEVSQDLSSSTSRNRSGAAKPPTGNIFSGSGKSPSATSGDAPFTFNLSGNGNTTGGPFSFSGFGKSLATTTPTTPTTTTTSTTITTATTVSTTTATETAKPAFNLFASAIATPTTTPTTGANAVNLFGGTTTITPVPSSAASKPPPAPSAITTAAAVAASTAITTTSSAAQNIFGGTGTGTSTASFLTQSPTVTSTVPPPPPIPAFGAVSTPPSTAATAAATSPIAMPAVASTASIFGAPATPQGAATNLFGSAAKPLTFGTPTTAAGSAPPGGLFASAVAASSPFGAAAMPQTTATSAGNVFDGGSSIFGSGTTSSTTTAAASGTNLFSNAVATSPGSLFGSVAKPAATNVFGTPTQPMSSAGSASSGGSLFGQSTFGQPPSTTNIFSGAGVAATATPATGGGGFGTTGSIFGGAIASQPTAANSIFGGSSQTSIFGTPTASASGGFGAFSQPAPAGGGFAQGAGTFAQGGASVAQTGFGAPANTSPFGGGGQPVFGGAATFGSPSAFGAAPSFGGAPTFGGPKPFGGTFAAPTAQAATAFGSPTQRNSLFEQLGQSDAGLSFGNLAQSTNAANAPKPAFGGSSFTSYRG